MKLFDYEWVTTFWDDFTIAESFGPAAIRETYERCMAEWKHNHIYLTELVMVLNHKIWQWYEHDERIARAYDDLWKQCAEYAETHLKGEQFDYYWRVTD